MRSDPIRSDLIAYFFYNKHYSYVITHPPINTPYSCNTPSVTASIITGRICFLPPY